MKMSLEKVGVGVTICVRVRVRDRFIPLQLGASRILEESKIYCGVE